LLWEATDNLNILLSANYIHGDTTNARPFIRLAPTALLRNTPGQLPGVVQPGVVVSEENSDVSLNYTTGTDYDGFGQAIKIDYEFPGGQTLLSITARDLVILKSALIEGDVHYDALTIEQGAQVDGRFAPNARQTVKAVPSASVEAAE